MKKIPWGIIAGICGIFAFYLTAIVIVCFIVFSEVAATTGQVATLFDSWWQTLLFVLDVLFLLLFIGAMVFFVLKKKASKRGETNEKTI